MSAAKASLQRTNIGHQAGHCLLAWLEVQQAVAQRQVQQLRLPTLDPPFLAWSGTCSITSEGNRPKSIGSGSLAGAASICSATLESAAAWLANGRIRAEACAGDVNGHQEFLLTILGQTGPPGLDRLFKSGRSGVVSATWFRPE